VRALVRILGVLTLAIGVLAIIAPGALLDLGRSLETPLALWIIAVLRVVFGLVLIRAAAIARTPVTFRVLGTLLIIIGVLTPFFGLDRSRALLDWWSTHGLEWLRVAGAVAAAFGFFLILAVTARRPPAQGSRTPAFGDSSRNED
jgi:hypothetical protein